MELMIAILIAVLFTVGIYMILDRRLLRVILGTALVSHGVLLFLITAGSLKRGVSPIIEEGMDAAGPIADPVPQALILTAIVISFATTAFALVLAYNMNERLGTDDLERLRGTDAGHDAGTTTQGAAGSHDAPGGHDAHADADAQGGHS